MKTSNIIKKNLKTEHSTPMMALTGGAGFKNMMIQESQSRADAYFVDKLDIQERLR